MYPVTVLVCAQIFLRCYFLDLLCIFIRAIMKWLIYFKFIVKDSIFIFTFWTYYVHCKFIKTLKWSRCMKIRHSRFFEMSDKLQYPSTWNEPFFSSQVLLPCRIFLMCWLLIPSFCKGAWPTTLDVVTIAYSGHRMKNLCPSRYFIGSLICIILLHIMYASTIYQ